MSEPLSVITRAAKEGADVVQILGDKGSYILLDQHAVDVGPDDPAVELSVVCLGCVVDQLGETVGRGLDLAKLHGAAHREGDVWIGGE